LFNISCSPEPPLNLYDSEHVENKIIFTDLELDAYWDYELEFGVQYDWRAEWYYGWDETDEHIFGPIGYTMPNKFHIRRYFTGNVPYDKHTQVRTAYIEGTTYQGEFSWGFWDMLVFNDIIPHDGAQSIIFEESNTLDSITVRTNQTMKSTRYDESPYTHSFYEPEELFSAYEQAIEINRNLDGFVYDAERNVWVKKMNMVLKPITYIYLTQVILHNNHNKVVGVDGSANLSGMARTSSVNSGRAGADNITVNFNDRWKTGCDMNGEIVDIAGGRLMTFGICEQVTNAIKNKNEVHDKHRHYLDIALQSNKGVDSVFVFDVTDQVRQRYKGGVITVELDMDTIEFSSPYPRSAFDAVVKDYVEETHEIEM
jgi:hypothetical protein